MCLITERTEEVILSKPMTVYKKVKSSIFMTGQKIDNNIKEVYTSREGRYFKYVKDRLEVTEIEKSTLPLCADDIVFDAYYKNNNNIHAKFNSGELIALGQGFHSGKSIGRIKQMILLSSEVIAEFEIPKGSIVYFDSTGLVISNKIIFKNICDVEN